ncbi:ABC transporter substrate-binding protein [uncultured Methanobacterium sp.]|uniref:ABC transporter substrate-binding protein n=1 Tax=uncultured Methanobacterium sp. TaxID=176306 RepID=UPI002AA7156A|nr:ABC transporter substrate-binding protein [uncultured Methanobacterium sp.]
MIYACLDDTDNPDSRGTGQLSRTIAQNISGEFPIHCVTRHQLYKHPDIPYTTHNTCSVIQIKDLGIERVNDIFEAVKTEMMDDFIEGSDPGLAVAHESQITPAIVAFGQDAKRNILNQGMARNLARNLGIRLEGLGGTEDGVIGAVAGIGLAASGNDGRCLLIGDKQIKGSKTAEDLLRSGIDAIYSLEGVKITSGLIENEEDKKLKPCPIGGKMVLFVEEEYGVMKVVNRG